MAGIVGVGVAITPGVGVGCGVDTEAGCEGAPELQATSNKRVGTSKSILHVLCIFLFLPVIYMLFFSLHLTALIRDDTNASPSRSIRPG